MLSGALPDHLLKGSLISGYKGLSVEPFQSGRITSCLFNLTSQGHFPHLQSNSNRDASALMGRSRRPNLLLRGNYFRLFPSTPKEFGLFPFPPLLFPRYPIHHPLTTAILLFLNPLNPSGRPPARERCETAVLSAGLRRFCACAHSLPLPTPASSERNVRVNSCGILLRE